MLCVILINLALNSRSGEPFHFMYIVSLFIGSNVTDHANSILNPFTPSGLAYPYQLDQSISVLRVAGCNFSFLSKI